MRSFTDAVRDAAEIGKKLNVGTVLEGNLQKSGERLRVTVQLINVKTGATLWADKFSVNFTDFFEVQDQIAEQVSRALLLKLSTSKRAQINKLFRKHAAILNAEGPHFGKNATSRGFTKPSNISKKRLTSTRPTPWLMSGCRMFIVCSASGLNIRRTKFSREPKRRLGGRWKLMQNWRKPTLRWGASAAFMNGMGGGGKILPAGNPA